MNAQDHWNHILLSNPQFKSTNKNGWDFRPYQEKRSAVWPVLAGIVCALIVCGMAAIFITGGQNV